MWVRQRIGGRSPERKVLSPVCSALFAALLLESNLAHAADPEAPPAPALGAEAPQEFSPLLGLSAVAPLREALPAPMAFPSFSGGAHFGGEPAAPIRLEARAVLGLREMYTLSDTWRTSLPRATDVRALELGDEPIALAPVHDRPRVRMAFRPFPGSWFDQHIELTFKDGVAYKKNFAWRGQNLRLKIWGPVLKGDPGLGLRLRGLQLAGHGVDVRARVTTELQDVQVQIAF
jgi:hypothetical protein